MKNRIFIARSRNRGSDRSATACIGRCGCRRRRRIYRVQWYDHQYAWRRRLGFAAGLLIEYHAFFDCDRHFPGLRAGVTRWTISRYSRRAHKGCGCAARDLSHRLEADASCLR